MSTGFPESDAAAAFARQRRRQAMTRLASRVRRRDDVTFMLPFEEVVAALGRTGERHLGLQSITLDSVVGTVDAGTLSPEQPSRSDQTRNYRSHTANSTMANKDAPARATTPHRTRESRRGSPSHGRVKSSCPTCGRGNARGGPGHGSRAHSR